MQNISEVNLKRMRESTICLGMLKILVFILVVIEPHAAIPRRYEQIPWPRDEIKGWHRARENHYELVRKVIIGHDHPYDRYSNMKISWPEEILPDTTRGMITFFQCINRTPSTAITLMDVIHGGTGSPEVVVDVWYAPVRFVLINVLIITCHVYTEVCDMGINQEQLVRNPLTDETTPLIPALYTTAEKTTANSSGTLPSKDTTYLVDIQPTTQTIIDSSSTGATGFHREEISKTTEKTIVYTERANPTTNPKIHLNNESSLNAGHRNSEGMEMTTFNSTAGRGSLATDNTTSKVTSFHKSVRCPKLGRITLHIEDEDSGKQEIIEILCGGIVPAKNEVNFQTISTSPTILSQNLRNTRIIPTRSSSVTMTPRTEWTSLRVGKTSSSMTDQSSYTKEATKTQCENNTSLETVTASYNTFPTIVETNIKDSQDDNSRTDTSLERVTKPFKVNMLLKVVPMRVKKRIGLAKITY